MPCQKIDFRELIGSSDLYNFHSHTQFCDGHAPMQAFAAEAVAQGFSHYGFSPHSPICIESPCNMQASVVDLYLDEVARLKAKYADKPTRFYASMEVDFLNDSHGPASDYFQRLPLDYIIGSVHFIPAQDGTFVDIDGHFDSFRRKTDTFFHGDIRYVVDTFFDQSIAMVHAGGFDIIGHYDKISHNAAHYKPGIEDELWFKNRVEELTDTIIKSGVAVEINTKAFAEHNRFFPSPTLWKRLKDAGVTILVNSDAHYPERINASRAEALAMLKAI